MTNTVLGCFCGGLACSANPGQVETCARCRAGQAAVVEVIVDAFDFNMDRMRYLRQAGPNCIVSVVDSNGRTVMSAGGKLDGANPVLRPAPDNIRAPSYYTRFPGGHEPRHLAGECTFHIGTALCYLARAGFKGPAEEDIRKAIAHLHFELERLGVKP